VIFHGITITTLVNSSDLVGTEKLPWANLVGLASLASLAIPVSRTGAVRDPSLSMKIIGTTVSDGSGKSGKRKGALVC
jgi:hypothetical protein